MGVIVPSADLCRQQPWLYSSLRSTVPNGITDTTRHRSALLPPAVLVAVLAVGALGPSPVPARALRPAPVRRLPPATPVQGLGASVDAANALIALPWGGISRQYTQDALSGIHSSLEGSVLADGRGSVRQIGAKWGLRLSLADIGAQVDLAAPPGFRAASLTGPAVDGSPGFAVEAPLGRTWGFAVRGKIVTDPLVKIAGHKICCDKLRLPFGFGLSGFHLASAVKVDPAQADRPRFVSATLDPRFTMTGGGVFPVSIPVGLQVQVVNGQVRLVGHLTNLALGIDGLKARMTGDLIVTLRPSQARVDTDLSADQEVLGVPLEGRVSAHVPFTIVDVAFKGALSAELKRVGRQTVPYSFGFAVPVPSMDQINQALRTLQGTLPRSFGEGMPPPALLLPAPSTPPAAFGSAAVDLENAISPHIPFGAVLSLDLPSATRAARPIPTRRTTTRLGLEADSSIWTGHYLAAEALRYAATHGDASSLARVRTLLDGVDRLFFVTGDAAAVNGSGGRGGRTRAASARTPVTAGPGIFARTARPSTAARDYDPPLDHRGCYYERPEGGWRVSAGRTRRRASSYREVASVVAGLSPLEGRRATVTALGTVWYGWGCGEDHPISRDQFLGLFLGLGLANQLVDQPDVRDRTRARLEQMLDYLLRNNWNVVLPPDNRIRTMFVGNIDVQLALLRIGATIDPGRYLARYRRYAAAADLDWIDTWFSSLDPVSSYFKFNLAHALFLPTLLDEDDPTTRAAYLRAYDILWRTVRGHQNAWFDLVHVLGQRPDQRAGALAVASAANPGLTLAQEVQTVLGQWLVRRGRVAGPDGQPRNDLADVPGLLALWPDEVTPYSSLEGATSCQARYPVPLPARVGNGMDFMWQRSPFGTALPTAKCGVGSRPTEADLRANGAADPRREGPAVDYLLAYWAAAYLGVVPVPPPAASPGGAGGGGPGTPPGGGSGTPSPRVRPVLSGLTVTSDASGRATVGYRLSEAAGTRWVLSRAVPGVRRGSRCVVPRRRGRHCSRLVTARRFTRAGRRGANRFRIPGRLRRGTYRLRGVPVSAGLRGATRQRAFRISR